MQFLSRFLMICATLSLICGCTSFQPTKDVWKGTKSLWGTYVSTPASIDYEDKGDLPPEAIALSNAMIGVDLELGKLERVMQNADKPPTMAWLENLFKTFPWITGFAGVKYDGSILGQEPPNSLKDLDFNYLLYEDKKQKSRALRADVQPSPLGPEVMLATPLYDGVDFLGIVVAYFDMRSLMSYSDHAEDIVVLCPTALLWPGKYDFASTPLAGVDWEKVVRESTAGSCSNSQGSFFYMVRYLGNLPLVFAVPEKGDFQTGNGSIEQGFAYFPKEREKMTPPPVSEERKQRQSQQEPLFAKTDETQETAEVAEPVQATESNQGVIQPGSKESVLLKEQRRSSGRQIQERQLEGENVPVERVQRPRRRPAPQPEPSLQLIPEEETNVLSGGRPSPFGPKEEEPEFKRPSPFGPGKETTPSSSEMDNGNAGSEAVQPSRPSPFGPRATTAPSVTETPKDEAAPQVAPDTAPTQDTTPTQDTAPAPVTTPTQDTAPTLPGGRPSPFGPRN